MNTQIIKKSGFAISLMALAILMMGCYEKFDSEGYRPVFTISGFSAVDEIEPASLVAYWSFDEGLDETISGTPAANTEATQVNGFKGKGVNFSANSQSHVTYETPEAVTALQSFTISFWVNPSFVDANGDNGVDGILGLVGISNPDRFWGNIEWFVENNSNPDAAIIKVILTNNNAQETDIVVSNYKGLFGNWSNHTLTYDAATSTLVYYINGSTAATKIVPWTGPITFANSGPMVLGAVQFQTSPSLTNHGIEPWANWLTGTIDELRIYNTALSGTHVNALVVLQGKGK